MVLKPQLAGEFRLQVYRPDGRTRLDTHWMPNIVTDGGLNQIGVGSFLSHCYVGSSSQAPQVTNSALIQQRAVTTNIIAQSASAAQEAPFYGSRQIQFRFDTGTASGNLAEVGIGWASALFSRALIVDQNGNPTVVTVLEDETLDITYRLKNFVPEADRVFEAEIAGAYRTCTARACNATSGSTTSGWGITGSMIALASGSSIYPIVAFNGTMGTVVQSPNGTVANATGWDNAPYIGNSLEKGFSANWNLTNGNLANGISVMRLATNGLGTFQIGIQPPILKTDTNVLNVTFKVNWARRT